MPVNWIHHLATDKAWFDMPALVGFLEVRQQALNEFPKKKAEVKHEKRTN